METTRLLPLYVGKNRDVSMAIADIIDYVDYLLDVSSSQE